jgi:general stress protein YciG
MTLFKQRRGFSAMTKAKQAAISSLGGKAAHVKGTAHQFDSLEARQAGRLGGEAVAADRYHMAEIGRRGGIARAKNAAKKAKQKRQEIPMTPEESDSIMPDAFRAEEARVEIEIPVRFRKGDQ